MNFRPCIDLHDGKVKQIIGSTLNDDQPSQLQVNFTADHPPSWFAEMYKRDNLTGGHVIMLGPGNDEAAKEALAAWPGGLQIGGGINADNGKVWLDLGASHVIVTSYVFKNGEICQEHLDMLVKAVGAKRLVLDLSCRRKGDDYYIVTDRWQKFTDVRISPEMLDKFSGYCDEFLIHAADVEGKCNGVDERLVEMLARWTPCPTTYAGGVRDLDDFRLIRNSGQGKLDATVGSALDIFGGTSMRYDEAVAFHRQEL